MAEVIDQPLKPGRRAFLKAMGAITGAALLPASASAELSFVPTVALPPVMPPLPELESLLTPVTGINNLTVFLNGVMQMEGSDFVQRSGTVEFLNPPCFGDVVINYQTKQVFGQLIDGESTIDLNK